MQSFTWSFKNIYCLSIILTESISVPNHFIKKNNQISPLSLDEWHFISEPPFIYKITLCTVINLVPCIFTLRIVRALSPSQCACEDTNSTSQRFSVLSISNSVKNHSIQSFQINVLHRMLINALNIDVTHRNCKKRNKKN